MDEQTLLYIMTAAIVVAAAAIVLQTIILVGMALGARKMRNQVSSFLAKVEPMTGVAEDLLRQARSTLGEVSTKTTEVLEISRKQLARVDELMGEATLRTRAQMDRIEMVVDDTVNRFQETTTLLQNGIMRPLRQLTGLTAGFRTALGVLFGARRTTVEQATHDEEMFI